MMGWRGVLLACAAVAAIVGGSAIMAVPRDGGVVVHTPARHGPPPALPKLVWWLATYGLLMGISFAALLTYLPLYLHEQLGFTVAAAGAVASMLGLVGIAARILWARRGERWDTVALGLAVIAAGSAVSLTLLLIAQSTVTALAWVAAIGFGATVSAWNSLGMLAIVRDVPLAVAGRSSGVVLAAYYVGIVASPAAFGWSVDRLGTYTPGWVAVLVVFMAATGVSLAWRVKAPSAVR